MFLMNRFLGSKLIIFESKLITMRETFHLISMPNLFYHFKLTLITAKLWIWLMNFWTAKMTRYAYGYAFKHIEFHTDMFFSYKTEKKTRAHFESGKNVVQQLVSWQKCSQNYQRDTEWEKKPEYFHLKIGSETQWLRIPFVVFECVQVSHTSRAKKWMNQLKKKKYNKCSVARSNCLNEMKIPNSDEIITFH